MGARLSPGSNGLLLMSRTDRSHRLFFTRQCFNGMISAPIKAALLELRPRSSTVSPSVFAVVAHEYNGAERERGKSPRCPEGIASLCIQMGFQ